jgi:hypothetical protein
MTTIYFHFLRFLANQQAAKAIRKVLRENSSMVVKFRYSQGCLTTKITMQDPTYMDHAWAEDLIDKVSGEIQRINAERQSTLDQLDRERYGTEDAL